MPINRARVDVLSQEKVINLIPDLASKASANSPIFTGLPTLSQSGIKFTDGTQVKEGLPSRTTIIRKTNSYTLSSLSERDCMIEMDSTLPVTLTVPVDQLISFPIGTSIDILQANNGQVTVTSQPITIATFGSGGSSSGITLSLSAQNLNVEPGQQVSGTGIVPGTLVVSTNGTEIVVDTPFTSQVSGQLTFSVGLSATPGRKLRTKWSSATLFKRGKNSWLLFGDLDD
jgi:hypothetical protein